ncbi:MAG: MFS transporter [bacterium]|nr:MFS transporter [bacterium]
MREGKINSVLVRAFLFLYYAGWALVFSFIPVYLKGLGLSMGEIGSLSALSALIGALIQTPIGSLSDKIKRRKPFIIFGLLINSLIYLLLFPRITMYKSFIFVYAFSGLCTYTILTASSVLIVDLSVSGEIGRDYASSRMWGSIGFLASILLSGVLPVLTYGRAMFITISVIFLFSALLVIPIREPERKISVLAPKVRGFVSLISNRQLLNFLIFYFLYYTTLTSASTYVNLLVKSLGGSNRMVSFSYGVSSGIEIPFMFIIGSLSDRIGRRPLLVLASLALPLRMLLYSIASNPLHIIAIQSMHSVTFAVMVVVPIAYINDIIYPEERGSAQGMFNMITGFASAFAPFFAGYIADVVGISRMYLFLMLLAIFSGIWLICFIEESMALHKDKSDSLGVFLKLFSAPLCRRGK